jgi:outer membrane receptor protein involved in Fe transport
MTSVSVLAFASAANAQAAQSTAGAVEEIVVTGSRVVNGNQAPTPVTVMATERLLETTPSNIPDALNRLPQFSGQPAQRSIGNAQGNATGNFLSLRRFGSNRNLILLDGSRVPPTNAGGAVDTNVIPQSLIQRVEVVTGGASAVYGSDAVTGVINFIIDKDFTGAKFDTQVGLSTYGDNPTWRVGGAIGTDVLGGRGHIIASYDHYHSKGINNVESRDPGDQYFSTGGTGTEANPFRLVQYGRVLTGSRGGMVLGAAPEGIRDMVFNANGVPTRFVHGAPTGVTGFESGGDGGYYSDGVLFAPLTTNQAFARFDYDLMENLRFHLTTSYNDASAHYPYTAGRFSTEIFSGNPFLPAEFQRIMTATNTRSINIGRLNHRDDNHPGRENDVFTSNVYLKTGFEGSILGDWDWNANYVFGRSATTVYNRNNTQWTKAAASADAVIDPATGRVVCAVSLTPFASRYAGCIPFNVFGPTAPDPAAYDWMTDDTRSTLANLMHDVNFSIAGSPFSTWAGPVNVALSGEYRWQSLRNNAIDNPTAAPDCSGLRPSVNCGATIWQHDVTTSMYATQNVKEAAGEILIPLLANQPFFEAFDVNLAGRVTDYSTSGRVETWKIGGNWQVTDEFRIRGTMSRDIRAPTLQDLFAPLALRPLGFNDLHTNTARTINMYSQGNAQLVPEVARTNTVGVVYQPNWIPRFSLAVDYYEIDIANGITNQSAVTVSVQRECEDSGGTSPLCDLFERPLPFSNKTPDNFPTRVFQQGVNAARNWTRGWDIEANYNFDLADVFAGAPGNLRFRGLVAYQPLLKTQSIPTIRPSEAAGIAGNSKLRVNLNFDYTAGGLSVNVTHRWQSRQFPSDPRINFDLRRIIPAYNYTDLSISYRMEVDGHEVRPFLTVENLFNKRPPINGGDNSVPGLFFPTPAGFDVMGRYFTVGVRGRL